MLVISASEGTDGSILITVANLDDRAARPLTVLLGGARAAGVTGQLLTGAAGACNDFAAPDRVSPKPLDARLTDTGFTVELPPCSVAAFRVQR